MTVRLLGVTQRMTAAPGTGELRDCLARDWLPFLAAAGLKWIPLPNDAATAAGLAEDLDLAGLLLTGGDDIGVFPERDATETTLIDWFRRRGRPILGVCRGFQLLWTHFGGGLVRNDKSAHVATRHWVDFPGGGGREVNSFHNFSPDPSVPSPAFPLRPTAYCRADGSVEAADGEGMLGIMWHPEREAAPDASDIELFRRHFMGTFKTDLF